ncbi:MAG TPA: hypothetical protein VIR33_04900 [Thermopolyspora sp.]|jgi:hypothetical protein
MTVQHGANTPPEMVRRQNALYDLYGSFLAQHPDEPDYDPDDDLEFVAKAREIMGLPPMESTP